MVLSVKASKGHVTPGKRRGGRPPRLSREEVVAAAIAIAQDEGVDALSMPRLAQALGAGVTTLYGYVESKTDLVIAMVDRVLEELPAPPPRNLPWRQRVMELADNVRDCLLRHPFLARMILEFEIDAPNALAYTRELLGALEDAGLDARECAMGYFQLVSFIAGYVQWELHRLPGGRFDHYQNMLRVGLAKAEVDPGLMVGIQSEVAELTSRDVFVAGVNALIEGPVRRG